MASTNVNHIDVELAAQTQREIDGLAAKFMRDQEAEDARLRSRKPLPTRERILIRAARLRVTCDRKLGHTTPTWVIELAQRPLEPS